MNRHSRALLTILLVGAVLVPFWLLSRGSAPPPATNPLAPPPEPLPTRGGTLVASSRTDPRSFNRLVHASIATEIVTMLTQGKLVRINRQTQEVEPWLAESWEASDEGRTLTFRLREGLTWSDGVPVTSADVLFTFDALYDPRTQSPLASSIRIDGQPLAVSAPDPQTVVIRLPSFFAPGVRLLDNVPILPRHKLQAALEAGRFATAWAADTPPAELAGTGPFVLAEYRPGQRMIFDRNPRYWRRDARGIQLPYADRLILELVPDQNAEMLRLQAGEIDFMQDAISPSDLAALRPLEREGKLRIEELGVALDADAFVFNLRPEYWAQDPRRAFMFRTEFRRALSHAVDREAYATTVFLGAAVPVHGPVTPGNRAWFWPDIPRYAFSREKARALLAGLGLANRDDDEWLEDARGTEARLTTLVFRGNTVLERGAAVLRDDWRQVGVALDIVPLEPTAILQRVISGDFDTVFVQFTASDTDPAISHDLWMSSGAAHFWHLGQKTPATAWEREIDELMRRQARTADLQERTRLFNEVQRLVAENLPLLNFAAPRVYIATSARLINLHPALTRPQLMWSADELAIRSGGETTGR